MTQLEKIKNIEETLDLDMRDNFITDSTLEEILRWIVGFKKLKHLNLWLPGNRIKDFGGVKIAEALKSFENLELLNINLDW